MNHIEAKKTLIDFATNAKIEDFESEDFKQIVKNYNDTKPQITYSEDNGRWFLMLLVVAILIIYKMHLV